MPNAVCNTFYIGIRTLLKLPGMVSRVFPVWHDPSSSKQLVPSSAWKDLSGSWLGAGLLRLGSLFGKALGAVPGFPCNLLAACSTETDLLHPACTGNGQWTPSPQEKPNMTAAAYSIKQQKWPHEPLCPEATGFVHSRIA